MHQNVTVLDYEIATHPEADHIGGLDVVITKFDCGTIFMTDDEKDTATYRDVIDAMDYRGYSKTAPVVGNSYALGGAAFTVVGPTKLGVDSNGNSIAILLQHGNNRFYFEGDAEEQEEADILSTGIDISADVYRALQKYNLPVRCDFSARELFEVTLSDKKRSGQFTTVVVSNETGSCELVKIPTENILGIIEAGLKE